MVASGWLRKCFPWMDEGSAHSSQPSSSSYASSSSSSGGAWMGLEVFDRNGLARTLGPRLAKGGEGEVYPLAGDNPGDAGRLVKIYHERMRRAEPLLREKIETMRSMGALIGDDRLAWPIAQVFDGGGEWLGFAMRRRRGLDLHTLCLRPLIQERLPDWRRAELVDLTVNLVDLADGLHRADILIGDINPRNFLFDPATRRVIALDCDSFQVPDGRGGCFPCGVAVADFQPPELHRTGFRGVRRGTEQENFAMAVMLFKALMFGMHPYSHRGGADPASNIMAGKCALGHKRLSLPDGNWGVYWSHLPYRIKDLFIRAFQDGHGDPSARPGMAEWRGALEAYRRELSQGFHETELFPAERKRAGKPYKEKKTGENGGRGRKTRSWAA